MEWHPEFRVGRGRLQVSFTGGHLCGGASTPASYETADPVVQKVIESSAAFRTGRIVVKGGQNDRRLEKVALHSQAFHSAATRNEAMEFDDIDKATDFLQYNKGIPIERLITPDQCVEEARMLGIDLKIKNKTS